MNFRLEYDPAPENAHEPHIVIYTDQNGHRRRKRFSSRDAAVAFIEKLPSAPKPKASAL